MVSISRFICRICGSPFSEKYHLNEKSEEFYKRHNLNISKPILGLLPGSRQQEVDRHWKIFSKVSENSYLKKNS